jgi:hypothetical protein
VARQLPEFMSEKVLVGQLRDVTQTELVVSRNSGIEELQDWTQRYWWFYLKRGEQEATQVLVESSPYRFAEKLVQFCTHCLVPGSA